MAKVDYPAAGTFGFVCSSSSAASSVGMRILEQGGNAFDAAVAVGFALQVLMPDQNSLGGEVVAVFHSREDRAARVLCGQGVAPDRATPGYFDDLGLKTIPRSGLLPAVTPGAFDAWMLLLRDHGSLRLSDVLKPAIAYARRGYPILPRTVLYLHRYGELLNKFWKSTADVYLKHGEVPSPNEIFANHALASTYERLLREAERKSSDRVEQIEAARRAFAKGFVADAIDRFCRQEIPDASGQRYRGLLSADDIGRWSATFEDPLTLNYHGYTVAKPGPWSQGLVFLQQLQILAAYDLDELDPAGADFVHLVVEAAKLAFADKAAYYGDTLGGDTLGTDVPVQWLLSEENTAARRGLIDMSEASGEILPSQLVKRPVGAPVAERELAAASITHDTTHIDVADSFGNMVSATPSGGWFDESPIIPELGFPLCTRGQFFRLQRGHPNCLAPGKRPLTTLSPTLVFRDDLPYLAFGTPGADQQDQWSLLFFLRHVHHNLDIASANGMPMFHTRHLFSSFPPFRADLRKLVIEHTFAAEAIAELKARGHEIRIGLPPDDLFSVHQNFGTLSAILRNGDVLEGTGSPRVPYSYCVGR
jgi:gamma-glutamyltranspeptidase/glutathione hydrolase